MRTRFKQAYKIQAVEKALTRSETTNLAEIAEFLGVSYSTLQSELPNQENKNLNLSQEMNCRV